MTLDTAASMMCFFVIRQHINDAWHCCFYDVLLHYQTAHQWRLTLLLLWCTSSLSDSTSMTLDTAASMMCFFIIRQHINDAWHCCFYDVLLHYQTPHQWRLTLLLLWCASSLSDSTSMTLDTAASMMCFFIIRQHINDAWHCCFYDVLLHYQTAHQWRLTLLLLWCASSLSDSTSMTLDTVASMMYFFIIRQHINDAWHCCFCDVLLHYQTAHQWRLTLLLLWCASSLSDSTSITLDTAASMMCFFIIRQHINDAWHCCFYDVLLHYQTAHQWRLTLLLLWCASSLSDSTSMTPDTVASMMCFFIIRQHINDAWHCCFYDVLLHYQTAHQWRLTLLLLWCASSLSDSTSMTLDTAASMMCFFIIRQHINDAWHCCFCDVLLHYQTAHQWRLTLLLLWCASSLSDSTSMTLDTAASMMCFFIIRQHINDAWHCCFCDVLLHYQTAHQWRLTLLLLWCASSLSDSTSMTLDTVASVMCFFIIRQHINDAWHCCFCDVLLHYQTAHQWRLTLMLLWCASSLSDSTSMTLDTVASMMCFFIIRQHINDAWHCCFCDVLLHYQTAHQWRLTLLLLWCASSLSDSTSMTLDTVASMMCFFIIRQCALIQTVSNACLGSTNVRYICVCWLRTSPLPYWCCYYFVQRYSDQFWNQLVLPWRCFSPLRHSGHTL